MRTKKPLQNDCVLINRKLVFYKRLSLFFAILFLLPSLYLSFLWVKDHYVDLGLIDADGNAPYSKQIQALMDDFEYSGMAPFYDSGAYIDMDFKKQQWILKNAYVVDKNGNLLLRDGKEGLCADLSLYLYNRVLPILDSNYKLEFVDVSESSFFPYPYGQHIALLLTDNRFGFFHEQYILDPSFRIYKRLDLLENYIINETLSFDKLIKRYGKDRISPLTSFTPLFIRGDKMVGMTVVNVNDRYDKDNYMITVASVRRHAYISKRLITAQKLNGKFSLIENRDLALTLFSDDEYELIKESLLLSVKKLDEKYN